MPSAPAARPSPAAPVSPAMPTYLGLPSFPEAAAAALADSQLRHNLAHATGTIRAKRARAVAELSDWPDLRAAAKAIKDHTLANLDTYLLRLEASVTRAGGHVHWAQDAAEANTIVAGLVRAAGADRVVKVKSMTTQETGLNEALAVGGIDALETDLAGSSFSSATTGPAISWCPRSTGTGPRSGRSSGARCRTRRPA
jgi:L-lactate dehydrogenase complex protein LldF